MTAVAGWIAAAIAAFHLVTANIWGYHRDEFYYLACGRRLASGYVDHPPATPLLYRLADVTVGPSRFGLRIVPALIHAGVVVLAALLARELGGGSRAQVLAAIATAIAPLLLTTGHFLGTVTLEIAAGMALALLLARLVNGGDPRWWLLVGTVCGIGLLNKWTFAFAIVGLGAGLLLDHRSVLATPWIGAAALVTAVLIAPNVWWQAHHAWVQLEFARTLRDYGQTPIALPAQIVMLGGAAVLAVPGVRWLATSGAGRPFRFLLVGAVVALLGVLATGGKPYYTASVVVALIAAGAVAMEHSGAWVPVAVLGLGLVCAPLSLPLTPLGTADALRRVNPELGEMVGWEAFAQRVTRLHRSHPEAAILTTNYSEAGAVELLAPDLPQPASGHNSYWYWGPPAGDPDTLIVLGQDEASLAPRSFGRVQRIDTVTTPGSVHNQEDGTPIWLVGAPRAPWSELWATFRHV